MAVSHRTNRLKLLGTPAVEQLQNGRYQLTVNCTTMNSREDWYSANKARIFPDFGSLESAEMSIDGLAPRTGEAYTDMRLVSVQSSTQQEKYIVTLVYQTLGDSFVQVKDDTVSYTESGLRRVTRESIAKAGTDFQKTVGTTSITSQIDGETAVTCILASYEVDDTDSYREVTEVYVQAGVLSRNISERNGGATTTGKLRTEVVEAFGETPTTSITGIKTGEEVSNVEGIPTTRLTFAKGAGEISRSSRQSTGALAGTTELTITTYGAAANTPSGGTLIASSDFEEDGYKRFVRTFLTGTITGVKQTYQDVVSVDVPGEVICTTQNGISGIGGNVAVVSVTPRRSKKVAATVTIEVTSESPTTFTPAYDLGDISCSVTTTRQSLNVTARSNTIGPGEPGLDISRNYSLSANIQTYPGCFCASGTSDGFVKYETLTESSSASTQAPFSSVTTSCVPAGSRSNTGWSETGILKRKSRPILTDLAGTTYYEVITWTV